jgi:GntR family transcriptional regulator
MVKTPVYQIIENDIKEKIKKGELNHGDMIHSENELKDMYSVSRMTVRQALNNLVNEGYLYRHKGKGTFVNNIKIEKKMQGLIGFTEEMRRMNKKVRSKIITFDSIKADDEVASKLFLETGEEIYFIERIRYGDDIPVLFEQLHIPKRIFKDIDQKIMESSFYGYIANTLNIKISHCVQTMEAKAASTRIAEMLEIQKGAPILYMTRNTFLDRGFPFEYVKAYYRADQYRFIQHSVR